MGVLSTIFGFCGFGVGISSGLVIGYFLFIYFQPTDVKVIKFLKLVQSYYFLKCVFVCCTDFEFE